MDRKYEFPDKCNKEEFKFGYETPPSLNTVKDLLQTGFVLDEPEDVKKMYLRSHGQFQPAEQKNRDYNWPFDINDHVFGKSENGIRLEAQLCLQPEKKTAESFPETELIQKNIEDFRDFQKNHLSKPRNLGQAYSLNDPDIVFGRYPPRTDEWNAGKCLQGEANWKETYIDDSLGHATRFGFRNKVQPGDENRVFGTPSIREDVSMPKQISVACTHNYGNEPSAIELLFPHGYTHYGLEESDIDAQKDRKEMKSIFSNIGINYKAGKFEGVWLRAYNTI